MRKSFEKTTARLAQWRELPFSQAVTVNPRVQLTRGAAYPFVDMGAVSSGSRSAYASEHRQFDGGGSRFAVGDTLMARITPCLENGKIARFAGRSGEIGHGSTEFIVIRGREGVSDTDYAYYLTKWEGVSGYAISQMTGTSGRQRVPSEAFDHLKVSLPPLPEQRAIAHILGTLDDKIELNRRQNETLEAMARALFRAWFVDFEPVRAKKEGRWRRGESLPGLPADLYDLFPERLVESEWGEIPEGWRAFSLDDVAQQEKGCITPGNSPEETFTHYSLPAFDSSKIPVIEPGAEIKSNKTPVPDGSVLVSKLNPHIPRIWHVGKAGSNAVCSTEFIVFTPKAPANGAFLYCLTSSTEFNGAMRQLVTGTSNSHQRVKPDQLRGIRVFCASEVAIGESSKQLEELIEQVLQNAQQSRTLAQLRDTLLPRLISGELRIPDVEAFFRERKP
ncbi:restriction endonuclease subunit S [Silanimonas lenta]|uniref:restriction endonuclease subunit S n=1 Tax=Silanimonas lenta TaxID=265429 RepID=UPI00040DDFEF|nr:restriction endonuclease subunit S [Silanimonas lenta]